MPAECFTITLSVSLVRKSIGSSLCASFPACSCSLSQLFNGEHWRTTSIVFWAIFVIDVSNAVMGGWISLFSIKVVCIVIVAIFCSVVSCVEDTAIMYTLIWSTPMRKGGSENENITCVNSVSLVFVNQTERYILTELRLTGIRCWDLTQPFSRVLSAPIGISILWLPGTTFIPPFSSLAGSIAIATDRYSRLLKVP